MTCRTIRIHATLTVAATLSWALFVHATPAAAWRLVEEDPRVLVRASGGIDQVLEVSGTGHLVRDYSWQNETEQSLDLYDTRGKRTHSIGSFGLGPERYMRLKDVAVADDGTVWIADLAGRLLRFTTAGELEGTRLVQKPGYRVKAIALDEARDRLFLAGCLPIDTYLNRGCRLVHEYRLPDIEYVRSSVSTPPEAIDRNYMPLDDYDLEVDDEGRVWFVAAPVHKLVRLDPRDGSTRSVPIASERMLDPEPVEPHAPFEEVQAQERASYLIDRLALVDDRVVVSVRQPERSDQVAPYLLQIYDQEVRQVGRDVPAPGRLVGTSADGSLYFAIPEGSGFRVARYRLDP